MPRTGVLSAVLVLLLSAFPKLSTAADNSTKTLDWGPCPSDVPLASARLQCAELQVPLNWSDPNGDSIMLGLTRVQANDTANRIGSLVINPGGPGQPASTLIAGQALGFPLFSEALSSQFDIVGMDPRGVGLSTPVFCDPELWNTRVSYFPTSEDEFEIMIKHNQAVWESCAKLTGPLLYNVDTLSVARDLEALRQALDEDGLNFLAISYGTQIAQTYGVLYPDKYRAMALDAIVSHNQSDTDLFVTEATAYESTLGRFAKWCNGNSTACALHGEDVEELFNQLVKNATSDPIPAPGCSSSLDAPKFCYQNVTGEEILFVTQQMLLFKEPFPPESSGWAGVSEALAAAAGGNGTALSLAYANQNLATTNQSTQFSGQATSCLDFTQTIANFSDLQYRLELGSLVAPITRGASQTYSTQTECVNFGHVPTNPQTDMSIHNNGSLAILLTQSKYDPSCSLVWAEGVRNDIEEDTLALRDGDGHTSYFLHGELAGIIDSYLVNLTVPKQNTIVKT